MAALFWLILACLASLGTSYIWIAPISAFLMPIFFLRFIGLMPPFNGYVLGSLSLAVPAYFSLKGMFPIGEVEYVIATSIVSFITAFPFLYYRMACFPKPSFKATLILPMAVVTLEFLNSMGNPFGTWGSSAYTQIGNLPLLQLSSVMGIWGIVFLIFWTASVLNWAWGHQWHWATIKKGMIVFLSFFLLVQVSGGLRVWISSSPKKSIQVAAISSPKHDELWVHLKPIFLNNAGLNSLNWSALYEKAEEVHDDLFLRTDNAAKNGAQLILWSEALGTLPKSQEFNFIAQAQRVAKSNRIYLGVTWLSIGDISQVKSGPVFENKLMLLGPDGEILGLYLKSIFIPGREAEITVVGSGRPLVVDTPLGKWGFAISFDMDSSRLGMLAAKEQVDLMLVPGSDWKTIASLHTKMTSFRAIEGGYGLVRSARYGLSAAYNHLGQTLGEMDYFQTQTYALHVEIPVGHRKTVYSAIGNSFALFCVFGILLHMVVQGWVYIRRRKKSVF